MTSFLPNPAGPNDGNHSAPISIDVDLSPTQFSIKTPSGNVKLDEVAPNQQIWIKVRYQLTESNLLEWAATYVNHTLYIEVPQGNLPASTKEAFLRVIKFAHEILRCGRVVVYFSQDRLDREALFRKFVFMGLAPIAEDSGLLHLPDPNNIHMLYEFNEP